MTRKRESKRWIACRMALIAIGFNVLSSGFAFATADRVAMTLDKTGHVTDWKASNYWNGGSYGRGGAMFGVLALNLDGVNDGLKENGFGTFDRPIFIMGGGGFGATDTWRFGGFGGGGRLIAQQSGDHHATLSLGFGLADVSRVWPSTGMRLGVGVLFGGGGASLQLSDGGPGGRDDGVGNRYATVIDYGFVLVGPSVGVELDIGRYVDLQLKVSYLMSFGDQWKHSAFSYGLSELPNIAGPFVSMGLAFGAER